MTLRLMDPLCMRDTGEKFARETSPRNSRWRLNSSKHLCCKHFIIFSPRTVSVFAANTSSFSVPGLSESLLQTFHHFKSSDCECFLQTFHRFKFPNCECLLQTLHRFQFLNCESLLQTLHQFKSPDCESLLQTF